MLEGIFKTYYITGELNNAHTYVNGKKEGVQKVYYKNGNISQIYSVKAGKFEGTFESYFENGKLKEKRNYVNNEIDGIMLVYNENGNLEKKVNYAKGKRVDDSNSKKEYHGNGKLKKESPIVNGKIEGREKIYYESGELFSFVEYVGNKKNGDYECYFGDGTIQQKGIYKDDKFNGFLKTYHTNGKLKNESINIDGKYEGYLTEYYFDGTVSSKKFYKGGKLILGDLSNKLDLCEGVNFFLKLFKDEKYDQLGDNNWINKNFGGIEDFRFVYFSLASESFLSDKNECELEFLTQETNNDFLTQKYEEIKRRLSKCSFLKVQKEDFFKYTSTKMIDFKYNKNITLTLMILSKGDIKILISTNDKESK